MHGLQETPTNVVQVLYVELFERVVVPETEGRSLEGHRLAIRHGEQHETSRSLPTLAVESKSAVLVTKLRANFTHDPGK